MPTLSVGSVIRTLRVPGDPQAIIPPILATVPAIGPLRGGAVMVMTATGTLTGPAPLPGALSGTAALLMTTTGTLGSGGATLYFTVSGGQIKTPAGVNYVPRGIAMSPDDLPFAVTDSLARPLTTLFPNVKAIRLTIADYTSGGGQAVSYAAGSYATIQPYVSILTALGILVSINDHTTSDGSNNGGGLGTNYTVGNGRLAPMLAYYTSLANGFLGNSLVWFSTRNEPPNDSSGALTIEQQATYNAIRATGNNTIIGMEQVGGGSPPPFTPMTMGAGNPDGLYPESVYNAMTGIVWAPHFYNWLTGDSADPPTNAAMVTTMANLCQQITSADGVVPVVFYEYGPATGATADPGGTVAATAVQNSIYGSLAWAFDQYQDDNSLSNAPGAISRTSWGDQVAAWLAAH